ncbi:glycosyltransferase family 61 protein [Parvibaculum sp.]|uniref:glycosyltransferase family 61 protein n=1 Tax=Parvibaculum sp. TaxID=2024848 RepID=UPI00320C6269
MPRMKLTLRRQRKLAHLRLLPSAERFAETIFGLTAEYGPAHPDYACPPFDQRPIKFSHEPTNGWVRAFRGRLRLEYETGLIYSGLRPIYRSTDDIYPTFLPATKLCETYRRKRRRIDEAIVLSTLWAEGYFHFLYEFVPKIEVVDRAGLSPDIPLIVPRNIAERKFFKEAAALGLFGDRQLVIQEPDETIIGRRFYVVRPDRHSQRQLGFPAKRFGCTPDPRSRLRLYVSRNGQAGTIRQILNEDELIARLEPLGFQVIDPGTTPLAEQMDTFSRASIVVGPHGAGLTNILFRKGAPMALVEMINDTKQFRHHFYQIARLCGYFYRATMNRAEATWQQTANAHADIDAVMKAVDEAIAWENAAYEADAAKVD